MEYSPFTDHLHDLTNFHIQNSKQYANIVRANFHGVASPLDIYIHANLFKRHIFLPEDNSNVSLYQSSGTSGDPSSIFFSRNESIIHQKNLIKSVHSFLDIPRSSLFLELPGSDSNRNNARRAASNGFSLLCRKRRKLVYDNISEAISLIETYSNLHDCIVLFGFTFEIYLFLKSIKSSFPEYKLNTHIYLIHGGGWKKLEKDKIDTENFNSLFKEVFPLSKIMNYYGMVEQLGSIYPMCEFNNHHTMINNDIIIRDHNGHSVNDQNPGLIQTLSLLPRSYPGHSILTEDIGVITGIDTCKCGRPGKSFKVLGRLDRAVVKGCSDAY